MIIINKINLATMIKDNIMIIIVINQITEKPTVINTTTIKAEIRNNHINSLKITTTRIKEEKFD